MEKLSTPGRIMFATGIAALGVLCILSKDFIAGRPPVSTLFASIPGKLLWAYISGSILIICGLAIAFNKRAGSASLLVGAMILVGSFLLRHLYEMVDWLNAYKALALSGGSFIAGASFLKKQNNSGGFLTNDKLVFAGRIFFSLFFIICGFAHFKFADFIIKDFIPSYIPFPAFWTYFCGVCLLAGGVGILIPQTKQWAALLLGVMISGWFILLHIPRFVADTSNASDRMGLCESFTFAGMLFILAGMLSKNK